MKVTLRALVSCAVVAALLLPSAASARQAKKFELTVDSIMRGPDLVGYPPTSVVWSQDNARVYFRWKRAGEPRLKEQDTYVVNADGAGLRKLTEDEARRTAPPPAGELSKDRKLTVFADEGDLFLYDHERGERRQLTRTVEAESNPHFTRDQRRVYFTRQNNLYLLSLDGGSLEQLTDIRTADAQPRPSPGAQTTPTPPRVAGAGENQDFLRREERKLIEAVREQAEQREEQERRRRARPARRPLNLPAGQTVSNLLLSPDGTYVVATTAEQATGSKSTIVPNFVTESAYTEDIPARTKVGDAQGRSRMAVVSVETGEVKWVEHGQRVEVAARIQTRTEQNATTEAQRERGAAATAQQQTSQTQQSGQQSSQQSSQQAPPARPPQQTEATAQSARDREVLLAQIQWSEDGTRAALLARAYDNKDRWVMSLDPATGKTRVLARVHDDAWVGGPGSFTLGFLPDSRRVYFVSERDGFAHLYTVSTDGGEPTQLTSGRFEVSDVRLSRDKTTFYFTSSEGGPFERHLYRMSTDGGPRTRLTTMPGNNQADISPDEQTLAVVRSYSNRPPELYLQPSGQGNGPVVVKQVTTSPTEEWRSYEWTDPPIVSFKARDGATVHARLYKPANFRRGGPAVIFSHGAGYLQNVHKWWSTYYREYMFHHVLMARGFAVLDIDYRGSAGYGRDWRTGIYRHMGGKDLDDHEDGARYLAAEHGVDPRRVGIYGGSYGGFITLMAMFTRPDTFAAGAALRPVTDWAHYNHPYTANILNEPQDDPEAYRRSSPIYFAEGLRGQLLICHGMVDTNVHFQDTVRLVERLIELRKENWELAVYPVEDHAFERADSWADEYKRILKLFTERLHPDAAPPPARTSGNARAR
ncbi:MAG TPA: prolyl oligopeptidase family serine peptidase [Pyrinomonadaceae bacterium]|jgi:dipeptidyl aminopeptidase/acylaminoacyl peptidase|nr:prolyl oligopeptidase family serine peptidase [Pyrinomonadaceae bacterium]